MKCVLSVLVIHAVLKLFSTEILVPTFWLNLPENFTKDVFRCILILIVFLKVIREPTT